MSKTFTIRLIDTDTNQEIILAGSEADNLGIVDGGLSGLSHPIYQQVIAASGSQWGGVYAGTIIEPRLIAIKAAILKDAKDMTDDQWRDKLIMFFNPLHEYRMIITRQKISRQIVGKLNSFSVDEENMHRLQFINFELNCPDPFFASVDDFGKDVTEVQAGGIDGYYSPISIPRASDISIFFGKVTENQQVNINIDGVVESGFRVVFSSIGSVVNPSISNARNEEYIKILYNMAPGDKIELNTDRQDISVVLVRNNQRTDISNFVDRNSTFFALQKGINALQYDAESGIESLSINLYFRNKYWGI